MMNFILSREVQNFLPQFVRMRDIVQGKFGNRAGGLNKNIAVVEQGREQSFNFRGRVLNLVQVNFRDCPGKQAVLFNIDHAVISNDGKVQIKSDKIRVHEKSDAEIINTGA